MLDAFIFHQLNGLALKYYWFDALLIFLAKYFPYVLIGVLFLFLLKDYKKYEQMVVGALCSAGLAAVITLLIRFFYYRPRPFAAENIVALFSHSADSSFPSLHTAFFFALATAILLYKKKIGILFISASCLIAVSRVLCGLHWPSDIFAGISVGILCALLVYYLIKQYASQKGAV